MALSLSLSLHTLRALTHKRIEAAAVHRSLSGRQAAATITSLLTPTTDYLSQMNGQHQPMHQYHSHTYSGSDSPLSRQHSQSDANGKGRGLASGEDSVTPDLLSQLRNRGGNTSQVKTSLSAAEIQQKALEDQALSSAKQVRGQQRRTLCASSTVRIRQSVVFFY